MNETFYQISLIAAYIAGMVALFAPCCISYLFPAYLGNVFKEKGQVLFMTFIYSLGIFVVMLPVVLGVKALSLLFFNLHDTTYLLGGVVMVGIGILAFLGIKLPMPRIPLQRNAQKNDVVSTFTLGIFSGITSACCAPVLMGIITLSLLSPTTIQSIGIGASYVLGMVTPLYLGALFIHKYNLLSKPIFKKQVTRIRIGSVHYPIFVSNLIASTIFICVGIFMLVLTYQGRLGMSPQEAAVARSINQVALGITEFTDSIPGVNILFILVISFLGYRLLKAIFIDK